MGEIITTSIPQHVLRVPRQKREQTLETHAQVGKFRPDRRIERRQVEGATIMRQYKGDRMLIFNTDLFRKGWDRIWGR